jgi:hypothetical protein
MKAQQRCQMTDPSKRCCAALQILEWPGVFMGRQIDRPQKLLHTHRYAVQDLESEHWQGKDDKLLQTTDTCTCG